jgi:hypothetical protein
MLEGEGIQQDANTEESSAASETSPQENQTEVTANETSGQKTQAPEAKPFHEDPRIQDYIQRQVAREASQYERRMTELQRQFQEQTQARQPKQTNPFVEKLREIDPKYAEYIESLEARASKVEQLEQRLSGFDQKEIIKEYESTVGRLHGEHKVPKELQDDIKERLDAFAMRNPHIGLKDLPEAYKQIADARMKWLDGIKRAERASYVTDKTKDSRAPTSQPRGTAATPGKSREVHTDREAMLASVVKRALKTSKAESDI